MLKTSQYAIGKSIKITSSFWGEMYLTLQNVFNITFKCKFYI